MITLVRTTPIMQNKSAEAMDWAAKAEKVLVEKCSWKGQVLFNISGHLDKIYWVATFESLAAYEIWEKSMRNNDTYNGLLKEASDNALFVSSGITDTFYRGFDS